MLKADGAAMDICRGARVREVASRVADAGVEGVWLWGAGAHCRVILDLLAGTRVRVVGLVDDALAGQERHGFLVVAATALRGGDHAILASDAHEATLWEASAGARSRGVHVHRLYSG
jgi:hypothetical protein